MATKKTKGTNAPHPLIGHEVRILWNGPVPSRPSEFDYSVLRDGAYFDGEEEATSEDWGDVVYTFRLVRIQRRPVIQGWEDL